MTVSRTSTFTKHYAPRPTAGVATSEFRLYRYMPARDFATLNGWLGRSYACFWGMQTFSAEARRRELAESQHKFGMIGYRAHVPVFYTELYDPAHDEIGAHYVPADGDCGMHLLLSPPDNPERGFSRRVMATIMALIFSHLQFSRVVVEPDVRNQKIHRLNLAVGIEYQYRVVLRHKTAQLGIATQADYRRALNTEPTR